MVGWQLARDIGRAVGPALFRRLDPGTAGTVGFLHPPRHDAGRGASSRARVAGLTPRTLAIGGAFTAVVVGLAAQQTLGNVIAGHRPAQRAAVPGRRARAPAGAAALAGTTEGVVSSLGLLYTTLVPRRGRDHGPQLGRPLERPSSRCASRPAVDLRARLRPGVTPLDVQHLLERDASRRPRASAPRITLEELDGDEVVVRIQAVPERAADGPRLAGEVLEAVGRETARATPAPAATPPRPRWAPAGEPDPAQPSEAA